MAPNKRGSSSYEGNNERDLQLPLCKRKAALPDTRYLSSLDSTNDMVTYLMYVIPEETSAGRQPHNLSRELYQTNEFADIENQYKGRFIRLQKIGAKRIPEHVRSHKQTDLERVKASLLLASLPKSLPCRNKEMEEINTFIKGAICDDQCLGRCLYIHGVPGTGKTMSVLSVMRSLRSEVDSGNIKPYCFVEINGLKLASPENIYRVIYEALNGHRVSWKKALHFLHERFVEGKKTGEDADRPCILLIDELDLLVTRNQSVNSKFYNKRFY